MKVLVTGASGFIGRNLVKFLLGEGHEVVCLARETSKTSLLEEAGAVKLVCNLTDQADVERAFQDIKPDVVYHCAAQVDDKYKDTMLHFNAASTRIICQACYSHKIKKLIYLSSVAVISGNRDVPLTEELPYKASSVYGRSKIEAERIVMDYRNKGLNVSVIRPCMVYGEEEPHSFGNIINFVRSRYLPVLDIPEMDSKLHLLYIKNLIQVLGQAMIKDGSLEGTFMIADKDVITIRMFLDIIYDEFDGTRAPVIPAWLSKIIIKLPVLKIKAARIFKDRVYDITYAVNKLDYRPLISTEEGLRCTVRHWRDDLMPDGKSQTSGKGVSVDSMP